MRLFLVAVLALTFAVAATAAPPPRAGVRARPPEPAARLVVLDISTEVRGVAPPALTALSDRITLELGRYRAFDVVSGREIRQALKLEGEKASVGCDDSSCAGEIASAFGARYVVFAVLTRLGSSFTLALTLYDSDAARVVGRAAAESPTVAGLQGALAGAMRTLVGDVVKVEDVTPPPIAAHEGGGLGLRGSARAPVTSVAGRPAFPSVADDEIPLVADALVVDDAEICAYDSGADRWHCGGNGAAVPIETRRQGAAATLGVARFTPSIRSGCLESVAVEIVSADEGLEIDWRDAVFVLNGEAVPARPLRPYEHAARVPAAVVAKEQIVPAAGRCVGPRALHAQRESDSVALTVGFLVGDKPATAKWLRVRQREPIEERALLQLLPPIDAPAPPPDVDVGALDDGAPGSWGLIGALSASGVVALGSGGLIAALMPRSSTVLDRALAGAGWSAVCFTCVGVPAGAGGLILDGSAQARFEERAALARRYVDEKRRYEAFLRDRGTVDP